MSCKHTAQSLSLDARCGVRDRRRFVASWLADRVDMGLAADLGLSLNSCMVHVNKQVNGIRALKRKQCSAAEPAAAPVAAFSSALAACEHLAREATRGWPPVAEPPVAG